METKEKTPYASDGFIVYQGKLTDIRYGLRKSSANGCGWIAAYNFLKQRGEDVKEQRVADELVRWTLFRGLFGTELFHLWLYLAWRGYRTGVMIAGNKKAALPESADAGVIYYRHKRGFHFVSFYRDENVPQIEHEKPRFRFLNAIAGKENHYDTMSGFLAKHNVIPFTIIFYWPRRKKVSFSASK